MYILWMLGAVIPLASVVIYVQRRFDGLKTQITTADDGISLSKEKLSRLTMELSEFTQEYQQLEKKLVDEINKLWRGTYRGNLTRIETNENAIEINKASLDALRETTNSVRSDTGKNRTEIESTKTLVDAQGRRLDGKLNSSLDNLQRVHGEIRGSITSNEHSIGDLRNSARTLEQSIKGISERLGQLSSRLADESKLQRQVTDFGNSVRSMENQIKKIESDLKKLGEEGVQNPIRESQIRPRPFDGDTACPRRSPSSHGFET